MGWSRNKKDSILIKSSYLLKSQIFLSQALALIESENDYLHKMYKKFCVNKFTSHAESYWCQTADAPGVDRERFSTRLYAVSARRATTRLIDSPTARGSYRMPYTFLVTYFSWIWSQGPLPREERGTERLGLGLRLPSRDPGPDPLSCTPPPPCRLQEVTGTTPPSE